MKKEKFLKLLSRKLAREISGADSEVLKRAVESSEEYRLLADKLERYFDGGKTGNPKADQLKSTWEKIANAEEKEFKGTFDYSVPKTGFIYPKFLKVAAVLVMLTGFGMLGYHLLTRSADQPFYTVAATNEKVFRILDDGTRIWLNKESSISYNPSFGKQKREIFLEGEAYFDVVKNKAIPLIIHAGNIDIEVKGTAFNVNAYIANRDIQVALISGSIEVTDRLDKKNKVLLKPNEKLILHHTISKNESNHFSVLTMASAALLKETRWTSDTLTFSKEKLKDLVVRMEKKYDMKIEVQSAQLKEKRFSGTFTNETIQQALEALKLSYPLTYTISNRLVVIKDRG